MLGNYNIDILDKAAIVTNEIHKKKNNLMSEIKGNYYAVL